MLNEVAKQWVKALRSGKYKQGRGKLRHKDKYCCLGVLTDLAVKNKIVSEKNANLDGASLIPTVCKWAGVRDSFGQYTTKDGFSDLARDNDGVKKAPYHSGSRPKNFKKIADIIESKPEGLFRKGK